MPMDPCVGQDRDSMWSEQVVPYRFWFQHGSNAAPRRLTHYGGGHAG
jgi:hypothetical protein